MGTDGPVRETEGPVTGTGLILIARNPFELHKKPLLIAPVPLVILIVRACADTLRMAQFVGLGQTQ